MNIIFNKAGSGSMSTKVSIPISWIRQMGISQEDRNVVLEFDGKQITIRKHKKCNYKNIIN